MTDDSTTVEIAVFDRQDTGEIISVWETSVRASHDFIHEDEIVLLRRLIRDVYLPRLDVFGIRQQGKIAAFASVADDRLEMLFVRPDLFGRGLGKRLVEYAVRGKAVAKVDVNEENPAALGFYLRMGFRVAGRDTVDSQGLAHPILHLER